MSHYISHLEALRYFLFHYGNDYPLREDGTIDFEALTGEFLVEGLPFTEVDKAYRSLPASYRKHTSTPNSG
jgi:hypothetical protein